MNYMTDVEQYCQVETGLSLETISPAFAMHVLGFWDDFILFNRQVLFINDFSVQVTLENKVWRLSNELP